MTLPEHVLNATCPHGAALMSCKTKACNDDLSEMQDEADAERAQRAASGEDF